MIISNEFSVNSSVFEVNTWGSIRGGGGEYICMLIVEFDT